MANLSVEEPDALVCARPGLWEPWRVTARATRPNGTRIRTSRIVLAVICPVNWVLAVARRFGPDA